MEPQPQSPYLREAPPDGQPPLECPPGWVAEPIGVWDGRQAEIVYNPRRFDICIVRGPESPPVEQPLAANGYSQQFNNGPDARMWVRDRVERAREDLARMEDRPAPARTLARGL